MEETTAVLFRVERKDEHKEVVAVFPEIPADTAGMKLLCYVHVGQHGSCSFDWLRQTRPATAVEYKRLKQELEGIGYDLKIYKRMTPKHRATFAKEMRL